jgi:hypothetical protein
LRIEILLALGLLLELIDCGEVDWTHPFDSLTDLLEPLFPGIGVCLIIEALE